MYGEAGHDNPQNGTAKAKVYVKFGPGETEEMPIEWAQEMLTTWKSNDPKRFGQTLAAIVTGNR